MAITLGSNITSLNAQRLLSKSDAATAKTFERLSSGARINRASDDAAGLAIADSLSVDKRIFTQAVRNVNDGLSLLTVADAGLEALSTITLRLKELAEQSANGLYGTQQRTAINNEAQELADEYARIGATTTFNNQNLIDGFSEQLSLQAGYGTNGLVTVGTGVAYAHGDGTFQTATTANTVFGGFNNDIVSGDINGDGKLDVLVGGRSGAHDGYISVLIGNGDGTFQTYVSYATLETEEAYGIALGDFNGDTILDVVTAGDNATGQATVTLRLGIGDGTFGANSAVNAPLAGNQFNDIAVGDYDNDGDLDIAAIGTATTRLYRNDGTGTFSNNGSLATLGTGNAVRFADLNQDGLLDILTLDTNGGVVTARRFQNSGGGTFGAAVNYSVTGSTGYELAIGDFNGDGDSDFVAVTNSVTSVRFGTIPGGSFDSATVYTAVGNNGGVSVGDVDRDGDMDIAGTTGVLLNNGDGTFKLAPTFGPVAGAQSITLGDLNGDRGLDLIIAGGSQNPVNVLLANLNSTVAILESFSLSTRSGALSALDAFTSKLEEITIARGIIGSHQSRLESSSRVLENTATEASAAESRIRDTDIAQESAELTRQQILQQTSAAVLAQANQQPKIALSLLSNV